MDENIEQLIANFSKNSCKPELFLSSQPSAAEGFRECAKNLYDLTKAEEDKKNDSALPELIVHGFDDEQIWQELELQNEPVITDLLAGISRLSAKASVSLLVEDQPQPAMSKSSSKKGKLHEAVMDEDSESEQSEPSEHSEHPSGDEDANDSDSDEDISALLKDKDSYDSEDSEEEKFLKDLLEKATAEQNEGESDDMAGSEEDDFGGGQDSDEDMNEADYEELNALYKDTNAEKVKTDLKQRKETGDGKVFGKSAGVAKKVKKRKTVVDDKFFSLADMEAFLEQEDRREERKIAAEMGERKAGEKDSGDESESEALGMLYEEGEESDSENDMQSGRDIKYEDFFGPRHEGAPSGMEGAESGESDEDEEEQDVEMSDEEDNESGEEQRGVDLFGGSESEGEEVQDIIGGVKSSYEKRQQKLSERIRGMEETALEEKPWQLTGEVAASARPLNSLLEEDLEFEQQTKTAPVITEETTKTLEDIIKQRIKDKVFDDVERKEKPKEEAFEYKKRIMLDQEKSKKSLGQVYEEEYLKQMEEDADEKEDPQREEIRKMMQSLFVKLDALSNFQYTPKPAAPEVQIVNNMPSIAMEEVQPVSVSDAALLAPEEVKEKEKRELKGSTEKTKTDRLRERKDKKIRQRKKKEAKERKQKVLEKIAPALGNKYAKEKALKELEKQSKMGKGVSVIKEEKRAKKSGLTSSKQFFTQLQEEVTTHIHSKKSVQQKKEKKRHSSSKLKL